MVTKKPTFSSITSIEQIELGKNNAQLYNTDITQQVVNKMILELELRTVIKNEGFVCVNG